MTTAASAPSEIRCSVCKSNQAGPLYKGLVRCSNCGYVWADLRLDGEELKKIYANNYFFGGEYKDYVAEEKCLIKDFRENYEILKRYSSGGRLLEIGAAYGFFLQLVKGHFSEVAGAEINPEAANYANRRFHLNVKTGDFLNLDYPENYFDSVVCWATLEHLPRPDLYLEKIARILKSGGQFAATTIDIESFVPRVRKDKWRQIHPPSHVSYFSKRTLTLLLKNLGLETIHTRYVGQHRSFDNVFYGIFVLIYKQPWIYNFLNKLGLTRGSFYLNLFDTLFLVARKV